LSKRFGSRWVLRDVSFSIGKRSRIIITGPNGAGKTTLLRLLAGLDVPDSGEVMVSPQVRLGYLEQGQMPLPPGQMVLDVYRAGLPGEEQHHITDLLASGLFRYEDLRQTARGLSSGQQRKLQLARLMAERANVLLLDEPTNFVSFDVLEALEAALHDFPGPIIAVSHDRRFMERFGGEIWTLDDGRLGVPVVEAYPNISIESR
jgi:macrolide transport system ATP-binding/permease protein